MMEQARSLPPDRITFRNRVWSAVKRLTLFVHGTTSKDGGETAATILAEDTNANRTQRPEKASGRDWPCRHGREDRDRRDTRYEASQDRQDPQRDRRSECTCEIPVTRGAERDCQEGGRREVGVMAGHLVLAVANEFLKLSPELTNMQLQKLVYISHGWNLAINGSPLVSEQPEAWDNGPVFRTLWNALRNKGGAPIGRQITPNSGGWFPAEGQGDDDPYSADLSQEERGVIDHVWKKYSKFGAFALSNMTHQPGTPWFKAYYQRGRNSLLDENEIKQHYRDLAIAGRTAA